MSDEQKQDIFLDDASELQGEQTETRFVSVEKLMSLQWVDNAKLHDIGAIVASIIKHGFRDKPEFDANLRNVSGGLGAFVAGNGRSEAIFWMYQQNEKALKLKQDAPYELPRGVKIDEQGAYGKAGLWYLPCEFGLDAASEAAAQAYGLDHNSTTLLGGDFDEQDTWKIYDKRKLARLARAIGAGDEQAISFDAESLEQLEKVLAVETPASKQASPPSRGANRKDRQLALDIIYTLQGADCTCCLAVQAGWKYGINSASYRLCPYHDKLQERHKVAFIDNEYTAYKHEKHLAAVKELRPKYATVRDAMTEKQCREDSIEYFSLEQILRWAEELSEFAENVIVIPKYDCIAEIPEKFMLGYSIPSSHGGTTVDAEKFRGRRIHLLGGSWKKQLEFIEYFGDDVLSVDNNYLGLIAKQFGQYVDTEGNASAVMEKLPFVNNVYYTALAISFGSIGRKVSDLTKAQQSVAEATESAADDSAGETEFPL